MFNIFKKYTLPSVLRSKGILGMNARNYDIIGHNNKRNLYPLVDDKVQTKVLATKAGITTPDLIGIIEYQYQVKNFLSYVENYQQFVIKPAHGSGGKGVLVIKAWSGEQFITASGKILGFKASARAIETLCC